MTPASRNMTSEFKLRKRMVGPSLGAGYGRELLNFAVSRGANRRQLLELSDISPQVLESLDNRLPLARYEALMGAAAALTGEPAVALQFGEAVRMQECSIVGLVCEACETTADVGKQLNRYGRLVYDDGRGVSP